MRHGIGWMALGLAAVVLAGCANDTARTNRSGVSQATFSASQGSLPALASAAVGFSADLDDGPRGPFDPSHVDSLIVTVDSVQALPDSLLAHRHAGEPWGPPGADSEVERMGGGFLGPGGHGFEWGRHFPFGPGGIRDSLRLRDSTMLRDSLGWGELDEDWYRLTLQVSGNGRLDLMHLPTDSADGLRLAVGTVPAGSYRAARLFVSDARIYFDTTITSRDSAVTFKPDTGYAVTIPSGEHAGIRTRAGFTIPEGAADVVLIFDVNATVRHAVATRDGRIVIVPILGGFGHRH